MIQVTRLWVKNVCVDVCNSGKVWHSNSFRRLQHAIKIIIHTEAVYAHTHPHRCHSTFGIPTVPMPELLVLYNNPVQQPPSGVNTGCTVDDFEVGDVVYMYDEETTQWTVATVVSTATKYKLRLTVRLDNGEMRKNVPPSHAQHIM